MYPVYEHSAAVEVENVARDLPVETHRQIFLHEELLLGAITVKLLVKLAAELKISYLLSAHSLSNFLCEYVVPER
jgi:hypothetical protein